MGVNILICFKSEHFDINQSNTIMYNNVPEAPWGGGLGVEDRERDTETDPWAERERVRGKHAPAWGGEGEGGVQGYFFAARCES